MLRLRRAVVGAALVALGGRRAALGQVPVLLQGIVDGEAWSTNASSNLLTRNLGRPG